MDDTLQSDNNNEEAVNQNGVLDENNNLNKVEKTKVSNRAVKTAATYTGGEFLALAQDGVINLTEDVTITSTVVLSSDLTVNGNGYTIAGGNFNLFVEQDYSHKLSLIDLTVNGVEGSHYVIQKGIDHFFLNVVFDNVPGIINIPDKIQDEHVATMINCHFIGCTEKAFNAQKTGDQRDAYAVYNCIFEDCQNPIFTLFQHSTFWGYNFIIDGQLVVNNAIFVADSDNVPIKRHQHVTLDNLIIQLNTSIDVVPEKASVYIDEANNITVTLNCNMTVVLDSNGVEPG